MIPVARTTSPISSPPRLLRANSRSCIPPNTPSRLSLAGNAPRQSVTRLRDVARVADVERAEHAVMRAAQRVRAEVRVRAGLRDRERFVEGRSGSRGAVKGNDILAGRVEQLEAVRAVEHVDAHRDGVADREI